MAAVVGKAAAEGTAAVLGVVGHRGNPGSRACLAGEQPVEI